MKHIGLTIGPIDKTIGMARKTRETWGASYLFSYMMRTIIEKLLARGIDENDIIIPFAGEIKNRQYAYGAGLYPDRLIFRSNPGDMETLTKVIIETSAEIAGEIAHHLDVKDETSVQKYIDDYFQFHALETNVDEGKSPILELSPYLDAREMEEQFIYCDADHYLSRFLENINGSFLFKDAFDNPEGIKKEKFDCLVQIGARELQKEIGQERFNKTIAESFKKENKKEDEYIIREFKRKSGNFKTYHKYIAIVRADGDNFGEAIKKLGTNKEELARFSRQLITYAREAAAMIHTYGGTPIYIGGDDLLFFAPVANSAVEINKMPVPTVFHLIDTLDTRFKQDFPTASLSYGMSVTYYKFPLNEALNRAYMLLFNEAKKTRQKNALAFQVLKHSGRTFGAILQKDSCIYLNFKQLLAQYGGDNKYLNSIVNTTEFYKGTLCHIGKDMDKVINFFRNTFDEDIHKENESFIEIAAKLFFQVYNENPGTGSSIDSFNTFYALLRTLHFLNRSDSDNE